MTRRNSPKPTLVFALGFALAACQTPTDPPPPTPIEIPPPPTETPVPPIRIDSQSLLQTAHPGEWRVVGLIENQGSNVVGPAELRVTLLDVEGNTIGMAITQSTLSNLFPGESAPYSVTIEAADRPVEVLVEPVDYGEIENNKTPARAELVSEIEEFFVTGSGELALMGYVENPDLSLVILDSLSFAARGPDGEAKLVAETVFGPGHLEPGERVPILALAPESPGSVQWVQYHDGVISASVREVGLEIRGEPQLHLTAQGAPFVVGVISNTGSSIGSGSVLVSLHDGNRMIGLWEVQTPRPMRPGEQLAFAAFGFPGISLRFDDRDPANVRIETRVEQALQTSAASPVTLEMDVSTVVSVGSAMFIRGSVRNPDESPVESATVYAEVRSSSGDLVTAGWSEVGFLESGERADFVMDLPIPVGLDATLTEYDLRAIGLKEGP